MDGIFNGTIFWVPAPWGPGEGLKGQISLNLNYKVNFKVFKPNFSDLLTYERYITCQTGFSFGHLGHAQGWDLGVPWGLGGQNFFLRNSTRFGVLVTYMNCTCSGTIFWVPSPWGLGEGSKI